MVNYYDILKVSPNASGPEIKSAYRRLARKLHPDKNNGREDTALKFARIAEAYEVLGNANERSKYDRRMLDVEFSEAAGSDSVLSSENPHAKRWRQMVYEKRYNDIIDRLIAEERRESLALQRFIFPLVALFLSLAFFAMIRPAMFLSNDYWNILGVLARIVAVVLGVVGVIHFVGRIREAVDRFAYDDNDLHDSVLNETELPSKTWSRYSMFALVAVGVVVSIALGFVLGLGLDDWITHRGNFFAEIPFPDLILYPPIFVLIVDGVHKLILTADG